MYSLAAGIAFASLMEYWSDGKPMGKNPHSGTVVTYQRVNVMLLDKNYQYVCFGVRISGYSSRHWQKVPGAILVPFHFPVEREIGVHIHAVLIGMTFWSVGTCLDVWVQVTQNI